ncbi:MAG: chemotaxis protein CheW, partial [Firmicutes bacterium]|nr:chemotaxis protein CheW [Bacillota bacterium]
MGAGLGGEAAEFPGVFLLFAFVAAAVEAPGQAPELLRKGEEREEGREREEKRFAEEQQFVVFHLAKEAYALSIALVREIIRVPDVVRVPRAPFFIEGVVNIRGNVLP